MTKCWRKKNHFGPLLCPNYLEHLPNTLANNVCNDVFTPATTTRFPLLHSSPQQNHQKRTKNNEVYGDVGKIMTKQSNHLRLQWLTIAINPVGYFTCILPSFLSLKKPLGSKRQKQGVDLPPVKPIRGVWLMWNWVNRTPRYRTPDRQSPVRQLWKESRLIACW